MRILVCGGRNYYNSGRIDEILDELKPSVVIHGGATGADMGGHLWAIRNNIPTEEYPADWKTYGKKAGYIRNKQMLEEGKPDLVVAFPGGNGTENMVQLALIAGVETIRIQDSV